MVRLRQEPRDNCIEMKVMLPVSEAVDTNERPENWPASGTFTRRCSLHQISPERFDLVNHTLCTL